MFSKLAKTETKGDYLTRDIVKMMKKRLKWTETVLQNEEDMQICNQLTKASLQMQSIHERVCLCVCVYVYEDGVASSLRKQLVYSRRSKDTGTVMGFSCYFSKTTENHPFQSKTGCFSFIISAADCLLSFPLSIAIIFPNNLSLVQLNTSWSITAHSKKRKSSSVRGGSSL